MLPGMPLMLRARGCFFLLPGAMDKHSALAKAHPDWILKLPDGRPVNAGFCGDKAPASLQLFHLLAFSLMALLARLLAFLLFLSLFFS